MKTKKYNPFQKIIEDKFEKEFIERWEERFQYELDHGENLINKLDTLKNCDKIYIHLNDRKEFGFAGRFHAIQNNDTVVCYNDTVTSVTDLKTGIQEIRPIKTEYISISNIKGVFNHNIIKK